MAAEHCGIDPPELTVSWCRYIIPRAFNSPLQPVSLREDGCGEAFVPLRYAGKRYDTFALGVAADRLRGRLPSTGKMSGLLMKSTNGILKRVVLACAVIACTYVWHPFLLRGEGAARASHPASSFGGDAAPQSHAGKALPDARYVGASACAQCHSSIAKTHRTSAMGNALEKVADSRILQTNPNLSFRSGRYTFAIVREGARSIYSVTDGATTISVPILYAVGHGEIAQTYLFEHEGAFYEGRVSFYAKIQNLDLTVGHPREIGPTVKEALGRVLPSDEARDCFSCHATAAVSGSRLHLDRLEPGVSCESCHGPGSAHIAGVNAGDFKNLHISNPGTLDGEALSQDFCGKCHRSAERISFLPDQGGMDNVRFQPYRIFYSKCYSEDRRISCVACHNPHESARNDAAFYDSKCLACHRSAGDVKVVKGEKRAEPACPVETKNCASCHMPGTDLPGAHFQFTDHRIRIVKPNEPYPK